MTELLICFIAFVLLATFIAVRIVNSLNGRKQTILWRPEWETSELERYMLKYGLNDWRFKK